MYNEKLYDNINYFIGKPQSKEQRPWGHGQLRYGTQCCAIGYALGYPDFESVRDILGFKNKGKGIKPIVGANKQIERLCMNSKYCNRFPNGVLEIGAGRGEISVSIASKCCNVYSIEPNENALILAYDTRQIFKIDLYHLEKYYNLINKDLANALKYIEWDKIDTIIMDETIEHITEDDFEYFLLEVRRNFKGLFIITNWIDAHPIELKGDFHIRKIDDGVYDRLCKYGKTIYRNGSHLVVEYK